MLRRLSHDTATTSFKLTKKKRASIYKNENQSSQKKEQT